MLKSEDLPYLDHADFLQNLKLARTDPRQLVSCAIIVSSW